MFQHPNHRQPPGPCAGSDPKPQNMGQPLYFVSGQFEGKTIRAELEELQKAQSGRKYARVDRRPLDPPPTILLRLFHTDDNRQWEQELSYEDVINVGIMCTVDLFPVPDSILDGDNANRNGAETSFGGRHDQAPTLTYFPLHPFTTPNVDGMVSMVSPFQIPRRQPMLGNLSGSEQPEDAVHRVGNHLVTESSKLTPALVGEKFIEPTLVEYQGQKVLVFVFGDLAVQREGTFIFRYRVFDIFSTAHGGQIRPMLAELYGGAFRVYSTREFPGLAPSTDLTRTLAKYGVRVTLRDAERKSKKPRGKDRRASTTSESTTSGSG
ncbi:velvet factor-domain-containing protein [Cyathus striatus]|nr:velvet factor-domain-containing protein [Cyathus striatus]